MSCAGVGCTHKKRREKGEFIQKFSLKIERKRPIERHRSRWE
jgi:hypothetical protein